MKVAIYCRLSEEDRNKQSSDDSESIQNQKSMLLQYCMEKGWDVFNIYSDDDYAGADRNRPQFKQLLIDAEHKKFDIILCKSQSRFTRELELVEKYIHGLFLLWNIRFISLVDNADTAIKGNKKSRQINGLVNEWYLEDLSENIKSVFDVKRKNGFHIGSFALYGYKKDPDKKGHLIIDEESACIVRDVFNLFASGYGKTHIARILNDRGIPNPSEYKRLHGLRHDNPKMKNSTLWKYFTISSMLKNQMYIGNMVQGCYGSVSYKSKVNKPRPFSDWYIVENTHEPIIDIDLWNRVQSILKSRARPCFTGELGLFAKKAKCAYCGYFMRTSVSRGERYLQCSNRHFSKNSCIGSFIKVDKLEQVVLLEFHSICEKHLDLDEISSSLVLKNRYSDYIEQYKSSLRDYSKKMDDYNSSFRSLYVDKVNGLLTDDDFLILSSEIRSSRERLKSLMSDCNGKIEELECKINSNVDNLDIVKKYTNCQCLSREMVDTLIDFISVGKRISGTQNVPIEIHWNF